MLLGGRDGEREKNATRTRTYDRDDDEECRVGIRQARVDERCETRVKSESYSRQEGGIVYSERRYRVCCHSADPEEKSSCK
jgi:hypothetical protein